MSRPIITCVRCKQDRPHNGRGLCRPCYKTAHRGHKGESLDNYPITKQTRPPRPIEIADWVVIERGERWLREHLNLDPADRPATLKRRPKMNRAEKLAILDKVRDEWEPTGAASIALGISHQYVRQHLDAAA